MIERGLFPEIDWEGKESIGYVLRLRGAIEGVLLVLAGLYLSKRRHGGYVLTALLGGLIGTVLSHSIGRTIDDSAPVRILYPLAPGLDGTARFQRRQLADPWDWLPRWGDHRATVRLGRAEEGRAGHALRGVVRLAVPGALMTLTILLLTGVFYNYTFMMHTGDIVHKVLAWTFGLFFLPMLFLGTISPQVIRLSVPDIKSAGRVAGSIYAWSTVGAIVGTFATGYFLIGIVGTFRVLMILAFILTPLPSSWASSGRTTRCYTPPASSARVQSSACTSSTMARIVS